jgi:ERCC4-type nuclease
MIVCDSREPVDYQMLADCVYLLPYGDYWIMYKDKKLVCERKTLIDLYESVQNARLNHQIVNANIILIELSVHLPRNIFQKLNSENTLDIINGIATHHSIALSLGIEHTFRILRRIEKKLREGTYGELVLKPTRVINYSNSHIAVLAQIPCIGIELAYRIYRTYGTLRNAFDHISNWNEIEGIGEKKLNRILEFYGGI